MVGARGRSFTVTQLAEAGVKRISFATYLFRAAMTGLIQAATEAKQNGTFENVDKTFTSVELNKFLANR